MHGSGYGADAGAAAAVSWAAPAGVPVGVADEPCDRAKNASIDTQIQIETNMPYVRVTCVCNVRVYGNEHAGVAVHGKCEHVCYTLSLSIERHKLPR